MKKIISLLLAIIMAITVLPLNIFADDVIADGTCGDNLTWKLTSDGTLTISGTGAMYNVDFEEFDENVYRIVLPWDDYTLSIRSVVVENGVTSIGRNAFYYCTNITSIDIPDSVTSVGENAFCGCTSLTSIEIPASLTNLENNHVFLNCRSLTNFDVDDTNPNYSDIDGVLFNKDATQLINYPAGRTGETYTIPDSVKVIGNNAFCSCTLTSIDIPANVTVIGFNVFSNCSTLISIRFLSAITGIYDHSWSIPETATIYGYTGSTAESYATKYNRTFVSLGEASSEVVVVDSGTCGDNLTWEYTSDGTLTISGKGAMYEYGPVFDSQGNHTYVPYPWEPYLEMIKSWIIGKAVTSVELDFTRSLERITFNGMFTECDSWSISSGAATTICGYNGSTAEDLAYSMRGYGYNITFESLGEAPFEVVDSGTCGDNLTWEFTSDGTLTIRGTGAMDKYGYELIDEETQKYTFNAAPWANWIDYARRLVVENGVTELSDGMLSNNDGSILSWIESVSLPASLTQMGDDFRYLNYLKELMIDENNETYAVVDNVLYTKDMTTMLIYPRDKDDSHYTMPETVQYMGNDIHYGDIFLNYNIKSVVLSKNLTRFNGISYCPLFGHITFLNPDTIIPQTDDGSSIFEGTNTIVIYGFAGSTAQKYAQEYNMTFVDLTEKTGELTFDGEIDREDALHLLYNSIFGDADYTIFQDCDYNGDGTIDRKDAVYLLYHSIFGAEEYPI